MKLLVLCLVAAVATAPPPRGNDYYQTHDVQLLRFDIEPYEHGFYKYGVEQSDGTKFEQQGELKNEGNIDEAIVVKGTFAWIAPNGVRYVVNYVADEKGYQPEFEERPGLGPKAIARTDTNKKWCQDLDEIKCDHIRDSLVK